VRAHQEIVADEHVELGGVHLVRDGIEAGDRGAGVEMVLEHVELRPLPRRHGRLDGARMQVEQARHRAQIVLVVARQVDPYEVVVGGDEGGQVCQGDLARLRVRAEQQRANRRALGLHRLHRRGHGSALGLYDLGHRPGYIRAPADEGQRARARARARAPSAALWSGAIARGRRRSPTNSVRFGMRRRPCPCLSSVTSTPLK